jgi:serine/threonine protein kinase
MLPATPTRLGRYEIVEEIGRGAMGIVYLAKDPLIGRQVALKTFRVAYQVKDEELQQFRSRFMREAQSAGILSHPNIVTIHDVVQESEEGATFIAMEFVRGRTLKELMQGSEPIEREFVVDIVSQIADALDYAHSKGVVHRDIKPANVLITADGKVKITDFGIARVDTSNLTHEGQLLGTPNYMAPEQILGREVDHRADIFSLGVVLYEALTRRKPFQGENLTVVSHRVVYEPFTPPEEFVPEFPAAVRAILQRALEKSPEKRYARAGELSSDLRRANMPTLDLNATLVTLDMPGPLIDGPPTITQVAPLSGSVRALPNPLAQALHDTLVGKQAAPPSVAVLFGRRRQARAVVTALTALAGMLLIALAVLELTHDTRGAMQAADFEARKSAAAMPWLQEGQRRLRAGDAAGAGRAFGEAERLAPNLAAATQLRVHADASAVEVAKAQAMRDQIEGGLQKAGEFADQKEWEQSKAAAQDVLRLDATNVRALDLKARADEGIARRRAETALLPPSGAPAPPAAETASAAPAAPADAALSIDFQSEAPEGVLTIFVNGSQVLREPFRFVRRKGLFRSQAVTGGLQRQRAVAAGDVSLKVYVTLSGRPARLVDLQGNFAGGSQRTLRIRVTKDGEPTATLD